MDQMNEISMLSSHLGSEQESISFARSEINIPQGFSNKTFLHGDLSNLNLRETLLRLEKTMKQLVCFQKQSGISQEKAFYSMNWGLQSLFQHQNKAYAEKYRQILSICKVIVSGMNKNDINHQISFQDIKPSTQFIEKLSQEKLFKEQIAPEKQILSKYLKPIPKQQINFLRQQNNRIAEKIQVYQTQKTMKKGEREKQKYYEFDKSAVQNYTNNPYGYQKIKNDEEQQKNKSLLYPVKKQTLQRQKKQIKRKQQQRHIFNEQEQNIIDNILKDSGQKQKNIDKTKQQKICRKQEKKRIPLQDEQTIIIGKKIQKPFPNKKQFDDLTMQIEWQRNSLFQINDRTITMRYAEFYGKIASKQPFKQSTGIYRIKMKIIKNGTIAIGISPQHCKNGKYVNDSKKDVLKYLGFSNGGGLIKFGGEELVNDKRVGFEDNEVLEMIFDSEAMRVTFVKKRLNEFPITLTEAFKGRELYLFLEMKHQDTCVEFL